MALALTSSTFKHGGEIPTRCTCKGKGVAPELAWVGLPPGTKSLALIVDDPDAPDPMAPNMTYGVPEGATATDLPDGTRGGLNDWRRTGYGGPCPPIGRHRYFHKLYALDAVLPDLGTPTKPRLETAMAGHILEQTELLGTYMKKGSKP